MELLLVLALGVAALIVVPLLLLKLVFFLVLLLLPLLTSLDTLAIGSAWTAGKSGE